MSKCIEVQAAEALQALLRQLSAVKVRDISIESPGPRQGKQIVARIDVYGRRHTLFCKVRDHGELRVVRTVLGELQKSAPRLGEEMTPLLIARHLSPRAQALCRQRRLGFLDLEGNAHLEVDEVFFGKRCLPRKLPFAQNAEGARSQSFAAG